MSYRDLLSRLRGLRVLVVGDAMLDEYVTGDCSRISPEAPVPVVRVSGDRKVLGGAANTAANVVALGGRARLIAMVGHDRAGEELSAHAAEAAIDLHAISDGRPTLRKTRVIGRQQQLVRLDYEDLRPLSDDTERTTLRLVSEHVEACDIVVASDYAKGMLSRKVCQGVIAEAHRRGKQVVVDPRPEHGAYYAGCDYLTPNLKEALELLGRVISDPRSADVQEVGRSLGTQLDANVLLTLGGQGMAFCSRDGREFMSMPTVAREVFDVSGAGDTVVAAFALARAAGGSHAEAMDLANRAAGIVVGKFGTATASAEELLRPAEGHARLLSRAELAPLATGLRLAGKRITTANGSFDVLHPGHLHFLREAKQQGDVLVVGVNSDASIRAYKGPDRPVLPEAQRAQMLMALRDVDYVHIFDELVPIPFLEEMRPDVHANGAEYGTDCVEAEVVRRHGGRLHLIERIPALSTTNLIATLRGLP